MLVKLGICLLSGVNLRKLGQKLRFLEGKTLFYARVFQNFKIHARVFSRFTPVNFGGKFKLTGVNLEKNSGVNKKLGHKIRLT